MMFDYTKDLFGYFTPVDGAFYVYLLLRPDSSPLYVGKGLGDRMHQHEKEAKKGHDCYKCRAIREIWDAGGEIGHVIIFTTNSEQAAFRVEAQTIARFRSKVINVVDGDPFHNHNLVETPRPMTQAQREATKNAKIERLMRTLDRLESRLRYVRMQGPLEERRQLEEEIAVLDQITSELVWPPKQHKLWEDDTL
jgi:hypothetical protein